MVAQGKRFLKPAWGLDPIFTVNGFIVEGILLRAGYLVQRFAGSPLAGPVFSKPYKRAGNFY